MKDDRKRLRSIGTGLFWLLLVGVLVYRAAPQVQAAMGGGGEGAPAPLLSGRTIDGAPYDLREYAGHVVLVNFWATWCPPCRVEMPGFQRVYEDRRDDGFVVLGLSMDATGVAPVREFLDERGITFPVAMAGPEARRAFEDVSALPTSYLIDRQGRIRHVVKGFFAEPALRAAVDRLLAESSGDGDEVDDG